MFDIGWSELMVVAVVAVLVVGPKDLPRMLRAFGSTVGKMKKMAGEFQSQFNEALREAEIDDVRRQVEALGDPVSDIRRELQSADRVGREIKDELTKTGPSSSTATPQPVMTPMALPGAALAEPVEAADAAKSAPVDDKP
jgi:sec-independent protein translocase protein TatB